MQPIDKDEANRILDQVEAGTLKLPTAEILRLVRIVRPLNTQSITDSAVVVESEAVHDR